MPVCCGGLCHYGIYVCVCTVQCANVCWLVDASGILMNRVLCIRPPPAHYRRRRISLCAIADYCESNRSVYACKMYNDTLYVYVHVSEWTKRNVLLIFGRNRGGDRFRPMSHEVLRVRSRTRERSATRSAMEKRNRSNAGFRRDRVQNVTFCTWQDTRPYTWQDVQRRLIEEQDRLDLLRLECLL